MVCIERTSEPDVCIVHCLACAMGVRLLYYIRYNIGALNVKAGSTNPPIAARAYIRTFKSVSVMDLNYTTRHKFLHIGETHCLSSF
jgi:hypothetical protein